MAGASRERVLLFAIAEFMMVQHFYLAASVLSVTMATTETTASEKKEPIVKVSLVPEWVWV